MLSKTKIKKNKFIIINNSNNNCLLMTINLEDNKLINNLPDNVAMITKVWGPPTWFFLHSMAMSYPKKIDDNNPQHRTKKNSMYAFLSNLGNVLPCPLCGSSYNTYIKEPTMSIWEHLDSRKSLILFIYNLHEKVNDKLGVAQCEKPSFKETVEYYKQFIANSPCKATTEEEKIKKRLEGCKNKDFKKYKCMVNIIDENSMNKGETDNSTDNSTDIKSKEYFGNKDKNNKLIVIIPIIISIILLILLIIIGILYFKKI